MAQQFRLDGHEYNIEDLSAQGHELLERMVFTRSQMQSLSNQRALLNRAKNAYIADLKNEIIQGRTGVDLSDLFDDD